MTNIQLIHGDCLEVMPKLPEKSVQMVFADLPYGVTKNTWDIVVDLQLLFENITFALSTQGCCIFTADFKLGCALINAKQKWFRYDLVWHKLGSPTGHLNSGRQPMRSHEFLLVFAPKATIYNPQKSDGSKYRSKQRAGTNDSGSNYGRCVRVDKWSCGGRLPKSVVEVNRVEKGMHPTQKPVALLEWLIKTYTNEGDTILDPTAGSGTTAIAAMRTGRKAICIEKDKTYYDVMCERVKKERTLFSQSVARR